MNKEAEKPIIKENENNTGFLLILTGGTAVGKTEIKERLSRKYSNLNFVVTTTTRSPRLEKGEKNGIDYHFISLENFKNKMDNGDFIEYASYDGNMYGTTKNVIEQIFEGKNLVSAMEISGAANWEENIQRAYKEDAAKSELIIARTLVVLVKADSIDTQRLRSAQRSLGNVGNLEERLVEDQVLTEKHGNSFKNTVINEQGRIKESIIAVENLIKSTFPDSNLSSRK